LDMIWKTNINRLLIVMTTDDDYFNRWVRIFLKTDFIIFFIFIFIFIIWNLAIAIAGSFAFKCWLKLKEKWSNSHVT
jgi:hypothetical protein